MHFTDVIYSCIKFIIVDYNAKLQISAVDFSCICSEQELERKTKPDVPQVYNSLPSVCSLKILQNKTILPPLYWPDT
jgi:hypothetical protein